MLPLLLYQGPRRIGIRWLRSVGLTWCRATGGESVLAALGVRQGEDVMHDIRGQDDEAAKRWEECQSRSFQGSGRGSSKFLRDSFNVIAQNPNRFTFRRADQSPT